MELQNQVNKTFVNQPKFAMDKRKMKSSIFRLILSLSRDSITTCNMGVRPDIWQDECLSLKYLMDVIIAWSGTSNTEDYKRDSLRETLSLYHNATCVILIGSGKATASGCWKTVPEKENYWYLIVLKVGNENVNFQMIDLIFRLMSAKAMSAL